MYTQIILSLLYRIMNESDSNINESIFSVHNWKRKRQQECVKQCVNHLARNGKLIHKTRQPNRKRMKLRTDWSTLNSFWTDSEFTRAYRINRYEFKLLLDRLGDHNPRYWNPSDASKIQAIRSSGSYIPKEHKLASALR